MGEYPDCPLCRQAIGTTDDEILEAIRKNAARGRPWACYTLATNYKLGVVGVPQNSKLAYHWYRKAADKGHVPAFHWLGQCYDVGDGVKQSDTLAWHWYGKGVKVGYARSQYTCAMMYLNGAPCVVAKDVRHGLHLLRLAAEQGFNAAQEELASCYDSGRGVAPSLRSAITWSRKAAKQDYHTAQHNLAARLFKLDGQSSPVAMYWLRKAAAHSPAVSAATLAEAEQIIDSACANCGVKQRGVQETLLAVSRG